MKKDSTIKFLLISISILLIINLATLIFIWVNPHGGFSSRNNCDHKPGNFLPEKLDFNDQQKAQFKELKTQHQSKVFSIEDSTKLLKDEFFGLISNAKIDTNQMLQLSNIITEKHRQIDIITFWHFKSIYSICDEKQKENFKNILKEGLLPPQNNRGPMRHLKD